MNIQKITEEIMKDKDIVEAEIVVYDKKMTKTTFYVSIKGDDYHWSSTVKPLRTIL